MKKVCYISSALLIVFVIIKIVYSFSLLESNSNLVVKNSLGKWTILVNSTDITRSTLGFNIDSIYYDSDVNVKSGKLAPGLGGYFDISIDPDDTEVSVRYDITFNETNLDSSDTSLSISNVTELSSKEIVQTDQNTYTGIISLSEINNDKIDTIRTYINWDNVEANNEKDYEVGKQSDKTIEIPVTVKVSQYTGEQITEYEGE